MRCFSGKRKFAGEHGAAESGGDSPKKGGRGAEEISSQRMASIGS